MAEAFKRQSEQAKLVWRIYYNGCIFITNIYLIFFPMFYQPLIIATEWLTKLYHEYL